MSVMKIETFLLEAALSLLLGMKPFLAIKLEEFFIIMLIFRVFQAVSIPLVAFSLIMRLIRLGKARRSILLFCDSLKDGERIAVTRAIEGLVINLPSNLDCFLNA